MNRSKSSALVDWTQLRHLTPADLWSCLQGRVYDRWLGIMLGVADVLNADALDGLVPKEMLVIESIDWLWSLLACWFCGYNFEAGLWLWTLAWSFKSFSNVPNMLRRVICSIFYEASVILNDFASGAKFHISNELCWHMLRFENIGSSFN